MNASEEPAELSATTDFEFAALEHAQNYRRALLSEFSDYLRGAVLEVGAGIGHVSRHILQLPAVVKLTAVEPGAALAREFRRRLADVELLEGTVESLDLSRDVDSIVSINVLEHVRDDERELATYARMLAARSGHLCLFVPARQEIYAPIDRDFGHYRRYEKRALGKQLELAGFDVLRLEYFNLVGYAAWWLNFCVLKQRKFDLAKVVLFDRVIFPLVRAIESRVGAPPIGQSLLAVARPR